MISKEQRFSLFVTVSVLLGVWMDVACGMSSIQLIPQYPVILGSVTLSADGINGKIQSYTWYRGSNVSSGYQILSYFPGDKDPVTTGPLYNSRMTPYPNGSLQISNLIRTDEGNYTVKIQAEKLEDIRVYLKIYERVGKPSISTSNLQPIENGMIQLTCNSTNAESILWRRVSPGANLPLGITLSPGNRTMSFSRINRSDSGNYVCDGINPISKESSDPFTITVAYGPENVTIFALSNSESSVSLECYADSVPNPTYQWRLNGTPYNSEQKRIQVDKKKMENEGNYTCVANNSVTLRTATYSVYVNATSDFPKGPNGPDWALIIGITIAVILLLVLVAALLYLFLIHRRHKKVDKSSTINGQSNLPAETQEKSEQKSELQYASIVFNKNMPKRQQQPPPDVLYANRAALQQPPETVYSDIRPQLK